MDNYSLVMDKQKDETRNFSTDAVTSDDTDGNEELLQYEFRLVLSFEYTQMHIIISIADIST